MTITRADVLDALEHARRNGSPITINPRLSNASNYVAITRAGDDAGHERLKRFAFTACDCCTHPESEPA